MKHIFKKIEAAVYTNKIFFKKKFIDIENRINLNTLAHLLNTNEVPNFSKGNKFSDSENIFLNPFQIKNVQNYFQILPIHNIIINNLKNCIVDRADIFFSLKKSIGASHKDVENSLILAVYKETFYHFPDDNITFLLEPGDLLLAPTGKVHFASSFQERIILSWGLYKK